MAAVADLVASRTAPRPPLKWAGGKRWLVPYVLRLWNPYRDHRLVEPLCGGLAISLGLTPERTLINDINPHAINFYRWLRKGLRICIEMQNEKAHFYASRERFNQMIRLGKADSDEAASLFYYLNRTCYNGLCRFNRKGEFNVPFGRYKKLSTKRISQSTSPHSRTGNSRAWISKRYRWRQAISSTRIRRMMSSSRNTRRKTLAGTT